MAADRFLDTEGLRHLWEKIKAWIPFLSRKTQSIPFGQVDSTSTATVFTATVDGIDELRDGVCCYLRNGVVTSASGFTININGLGAKPVYNTMASATALTTHFNINYTMLFIYNSTRVSGGCWDMYVGYDTNTTYNLNTNYTTIGHINVGAYPLSYYSLCAFDVNDKLTPFVTTATTSTGKTLVSSTFPVGAKIYASNYSMSADTANNDLGAILTTVASFDLRYSSVNHNLAIFPNNTFNRIFMPVLVNVTNNTFTLTTQTTSGYTNNFTNERSLKPDNFYVEIGFNANRSYSYYYTLIQENRLYYYDGTKLIEYSIYKSSIIDVPEYTIEKLANAETNYIASYILKKDNVQVGATINIPKDYLVKSGEVIDVVEYNGQYYDATDTGHTTPLPVTSAGKYLDFVVNTVEGSGSTSHIYIAVDDLVDAYVAGNGIDISSNNYIAVKINNSQANGLGVGGDGLSLGVVTPSVNGVGGTNGAMTAADKEKLDGISAGAGVQVQSDWEQQSLNLPDYIKNKPLGEYVIINGTSDAYGIQPFSLCAFALSNGGTTMNMTSFTTSGGTGAKAPIEGKVFPIGCKIYYTDSSTASQSNKSFTSRRFYTSYKKVDARYSAITGTEVSLSTSINSTVYLHVMLDHEYWCPYYKDGSTVELVVTSEQLVSGNFYIYLGKTTGSEVYEFQLDDNNPLYYYDGEKLIDWATKQGQAGVLILENYLKAGEEIGHISVNNFNPVNDTVHVTPQVLGASQKQQARENIDAQQTLISGVNIKTINKESLLGDSDIVLPTVDQCYTKDIVTTMPNDGFHPDVVYDIGGVSGIVNFSLANAVQGKINHYFWIFRTGGTLPTSLEWPVGIQWVDFDEPTIETWKYYEISVLNGVAVYTKVGIRPT